MRYLLDTNILSETIRPHPHENVQKWLTEIPPASLFISVLTLGEIRKGVEKVADPQRKNHLLFWLEEELPRWFGENILPIDGEVADRWGYLTSLLTRPHQLTAIDTLLAATALAHNLKMVTRNVKDFDVPGLEVYNPFN